jgi:hypothetical protein
MRDLLWRCDEHRGPDADYPALRGYPRVNTGIAFVSGEPRNWRAQWRQLRRPAGVAGRRLLCRERDAQFAALPDRPLVAKAQARRRPALGRNQSSPGVCRHDRRRSDAEAGGGSCPAVPR